MPKLVPCRAFNKSLSVLMTADPDFFGGDGVVITLVTNDFTPSDTLDPATLVAATFTGSTPITLPEAATGVIRNRDTAGYGIRLNGLTECVPLFWLCTADRGSAELITGYFIAKADGALIASCRFDEPIPVQFQFDFVELSEVFGFLPAEPFGTDISVG